MFRSCDVCEDNIAEVIRYCIQVDDMSIFYLSQAWERLRNKVMEEFKGECQMHKDRGFYRRASIVHHVKYVRTNPELALSRFYYDEKGHECNQLIPVCAECHRIIHGSDKDFKPRFNTVERWD